MADRMLFRVSSRILADSRRNILKPRKKWDNTRRLAVFG